jgi:hypothetical protein
VQEQGLSRAEVQRLPLGDKDLKDVIAHPTNVSSGSETDKDLVLHVQIVLRIRMPHRLKDEWQPLQSSTTINRGPHHLLLELSRNTMATPLDNSTSSGLVCVYRSIVLEYHLQGLEECLRSWENSTNLCARA